MCSKDDQENAPLADKKKVAKWLGQVQTGMATLKAIKADFKGNSVNSQTGVNGCLLWGVCCEVLWGVCCEALSNI